MKIICIYHKVDLDGWMSAAIVKHWFINKYSKDYYILNEDGSIDKTAPGISSNLLNFLGYNYGQPIPDLSGYDQVIMCDISFPKEEMIKLALKFGLNFIWNDHHYSAINDFKCSDVEGGYYPNGNRDTKYAACELTWNYFFPDETMPEIVRLLGRYDCFGHKGTIEEQTVLEFQYGARQYISNYEEAFTELLYSLQNYPIASEIPILESGKAIYKYLCQEAKQIYKNGFSVSLPNITIPEEEYVFICINKERFNPINFGIDYHKDGYDGSACFHYANRKWNFSIYNDNGLVDCSTIAKFYGGGGHKGASGFIVNDINEFLNLNK